MFVVNTNTHTHTQRHSQTHQWIKQQNLTEQNELSRKNLNLNMFFLSHIYNCIFKKRENKKGVHT